MLAKLHDAPFDDPNWLFEIKWDGYRAIAELDGNEGRLYSRNGLSFEQYYPAIYKALLELDIHAVLDGEIVALDEHGQPSFQLLQHATTTDTTLCYYVFDLLEMNGHSLLQEDLADRKELLQQLLSGRSELIRYCDHVQGEGKKFFAMLKEHHMEGMIAKRADSPYLEDSRSADWLKIKHVLTDEAVIAGFTAPRGSRRYFGSLVLGRYEGGRLKFIGHAGTGFDTRSLREVYEAMKSLETDDNPFSEKIPVNAPVTWLEPRLVCQVKFTEKTKEGIHRHPVFMGLRADKAADEVTGADAAKPAKQKDMDGSVKAGGHMVKLTNTDKIYWPDEGYTKGDMLSYYDAVSGYILKYLKARPMSLKRNPNGIKEEAFYHKDAAGEAPAWVHRKAVWSDSSEKEVNYILCDNKATLLYLANLGCIEMNPWHSTVKHLDNPDYLVIDLDPADGNTFDQVIETARAVKEVLDTAGAISFLKTSGSTGLHIYVPLKGKYDYDQTTAFAEIIASKAQELVPDFTSLERSLKKRGNNIYIDYLQNRIGQTIAAPYSLRPKPQAPVATPLEWKELKKGLSIEQFNITNIFKRLEKKGDLFADLFKKGINMAACLKKLGG